ncbi:MAG: NAD(P)/FAD-dependent oxidoreductase [Acidobacteria bacterium]|nr:NAD(P)/FAD-dependent oxidoreductase [Acidobacteriota bacterium]
MAGSYAGLLLARQGHEVLLLDPSLEGEKPCGGGVTGRAWRRISWFREHSLPHTVISRLKLVFPEHGECSLAFRHPILIYSRSELDGALRDSALRAGVQLREERAVCVTAHAGGWAIQTRTRCHEVDFLIGADGARSTVRRCLSGSYGASDLLLALGFHVPGHFHQDTAVASFQELGFRGYLWSFPRLDHSSIGILRWMPDADAGDLKQRVRDFIDRHYGGAGAAGRFYAACIPCLSRRRLLGQRVCGHNWALLGDAAGFADAITGEGIYYALRSAELLAQALGRGKPREYESGWREDFGGELALAAAWSRRFYGGGRICKALARRALQAAGRSPRIQALIDEVVAGNRTYRSFICDLLLQSPRITMDLLSNGTGRTF